MKIASAPELTAHAGSVAAILSSLTLTDWGVIVGIITALVTCGANVAYTYLRNRREQRASEAAIAKLEGDQ